MNIGAKLKKLELTHNQDVSVVFLSFRDNIEDLGPKTLNLASLRGSNNRKNDF
jgi:hypothetical protein